MVAPLSGAITIKWKADKTTPIAPASTTMTITDVRFTGFTTPWGALQGQFSLDTGGLTGAFTGGDGGATSSNASVTSQDIGEILAACGSPGGLGRIDTGMGQIKLQ